MYMYMCMYMYMYMYMSMSCAQHVSHRLYCNVHRFIKPILNTIYINHVYSIYSIINPFISHSYFNLILPLTRLQVPHAATSRRWGSAPAAACWARSHRSPRSHRSRSKVHAAGRWGDPTRPPPARKAETSKFPGKKSVPSKILKIVFEKNSKWKCISEGFLGDK